MGFVMGVAVGGTDFPWVFGPLLLVLAVFATFFSGLVPKSGKGDEYSESELSEPDNSSSASTF